MQTITTLDNFMANGSCSARTIVYDVSGEIIKDTRRALSPGEFEVARELLSTEDFTRLEALWTPEAITAWDEYLAQQEDEMAANQPDPAPTTQPLQDQITDIQIALAELYEGMVL